jgi:hypothetical protein
VGESLHLITEAGEIHIELSPETESEGMLSTCDEAMRAGRVVEFPDALAPGAVRRSTVVVNFARVSVAWLQASPS